MTALTVGEGRAPKEHVEELLRRHLGLELLSVAPVPVPGWVAGLLLPVLVVLAPLAGVTERGVGVADCCNNNNTSVVCTMYDVTLGIPASNNLRIKKNYEGIRYNHGLNINT